MRDGAGGWSKSGRAVVIAVLISGGPTHTSRRRTRRGRASPPGTGPVSHANLGDVRSVVAALDEEGEHWRELLRVPQTQRRHLSFARGGTDGQSPHTEDEIYYVIDGEAIFVLDGERIPAARGCVLHVPAHVPHRSKPSNAT